MHCSSRWRASKRRASCKTIDVYILFINSLLKLLVLFLLFRNWQLIINSLIFTYDEYSPFCLRSIWSQKDEGSLSYSTMKSWQNSSAITLFPWTRGIRTRSCLNLSLSIENKVVEHPINILINISDRTEMDPSNSDEDSSWTCWYQGWC